jgi:hypothetical protein
MIRTEQEKRDKKIIQAYLAGGKIRYISAIFGLYPQRIYQILEKYKIKVVKKLDK